MKSLIFYEPGDIRLEEMPKPVPGPKDAVIRIARAGICGSDLKAYLFDGHSVGILNKGEFGVDGQFGHEMVGTIEEIGSETEGIAVGDRVFVNPMRCKRNGMLSCDMSGAFSEYVLAEDAAYGYNLRKLQDHVSFDEAVLTEPLGVATHGKNIIGIKPWENVVIYGGGTIGLCALQAAIAAGCRKPVLIDHHDDRIAKAEAIGGCGINSAKNPDVAKALIDHFGFVLSPFYEKKVNVDAWLDCAATGNIINEICSMTKPGARIAVLGVYREAPRIDMGPFGSSEITLCGSLGYNDFDITESMNTIEAHGEKLSKIITHQFPIDLAVEAFKTAADKSTGAIKVVINYDL